MATLMQQAIAARDRDDFALARAVFDGIREAQGANPQPFVLQQLALATYKSKHPDPLSALLCAREMLKPLDPGRTLDPETTGLWGAIHKRLAELPQRSEAERSGDIDTAIEALDRGFKLKHDHYNGINLAYMLDVRGARSSGEEATADRVDARRVRGRVADICRTQLEAGVVADTPEKAKEERFWIRASLAEAEFGLGDKDAPHRLEEAPETKAVKNWMLLTAREQLEKLAKLLPP
jgi:hypothetical protein